MRFAALIAVLASAPVAAQVPIAIAESGHATVPVEGPFGTRQFVFDTGAEGSAVYADFAAAAALQQGGTETLQGQTGASADVATVILPDVTLDGVAKRGLSAVRLDRRADGVPLAGIVGLDLFGDRLVDFDLPARRLALLPSGSPPPGLASRPVRAVPTTGGLLTVPIRIGTVEAVAVLDTGARKTKINWTLGRLLGIHPGSAAKGDIIQGATNQAVETSLSALRDVRLGDRLLQSAPVLVADLPVFKAFGVADRPAVILGLDWLSETRLIIDFPERQVWFEAAPATTVRQKGL